LRKGGGEKGGDPAEKGQTGDGERDRKKKQLEQGGDPEEGRGVRGDLFAQAGEAEEMSPGMEGDKICANGKEGRAEKEKQDKKASFDPVLGRKLGEKVKGDGE
jgi:hypothetical protein